MMTFRAFRADAINELRRLYPDRVEQFHALAHVSPFDACSAWMGDKLIACGGIEIDWTGAGRAWLVLTPYADDISPVRIVQTVRRKLAEMVEEHQCQRVEAHVACNDHQAIKLARVLGFRREGRMQAFFPDGSDAYLYAWIRGRVAKKVRPRGLIA